MELIHLYMKKRGIRFFANIRKQLSESLSENRYRYYDSKEGFLAELAKRESEYDVILITAHGAEDSIIIPITQYDSYRQEHPERSNDKYRTYISAKETYFFKNDFVFAVSCLTAKELGPEVVKNGVLSYLGYDVIIENLFNVSNIDLSSSIRKLYEGIVKKIFVDSLCKSINKFLDDMQSVLMLKQWFALHLEKELLNFFNMNSIEIYQTYKIGISEDVWNKNKQKLQIQQLNFLGEINKHLIILGDPMYISMYGIENHASIGGNTYKRLICASFQNKEYEKKFKSKLKYLVEVLDE